MSLVERTLENRLVAYLETFQEDGDPLEDFDILAGHRTGERPPTYIVVTVTSSGGDLAYAGVEECQIQILVITQADDIAMALHDSAVAAIRAILSENQIPEIIEEINDEDFALSTICYDGAEEARDEEENKHGTGLAYRGWASSLE